MASQPLCNRIIRQTTGTCFFNASLNGFLQSSKTLTLFAERLTAYLHHLTLNALSTKNSAHTIVAFVDKRAFCPPRSLINAIATSGSLEPRFEAARFLIMKAIYTFTRHFEEFHSQPSQNVSGSIAKYVIDTTKKQLGDVSIEGGLPIAASKAILKSVFGHEYDARVLYRFESQMADPVPDTVVIVMMLPGLEGDQWLFVPEKLHEGFAPENIAALYNAMLSTYSKALMRASEIGVIGPLIKETLANKPSPNSTLSPIVELQLSNKVRHVVQAMIAVFTEFTRSAKFTEFTQSRSAQSTPSKKRKHATINADELTVKNASKVFAELKQSSPSAYAEFMDKVRADPRFVAMSADLTEYATQMKSKIEKQIKKLRRVGVNYSEQRPLKLAFGSGFELSHALFSQTIPGHGRHSVAGILCQNKPFIVDSNLPTPYSSDWPSGNGRFFQYPQAKDEPAYTTTDISMLCACYVRKTVRSFDGGGAKTKRNAKQASKRV